MRRAIAEFSPASRRRLMRYLNSINRDEVPVPVFVTLTYHDIWPESRCGRKKHIDALQKRLERKYGRFAAIWRLEFKVRKSGSREGDVAPHYHLLFFLRPEQVVGHLSVGSRAHRREALQRVRNNVAWMWNDIVDPTNMKHLETATRVEEIRSWKGVNSYASKYMGKLETLQAGQESPGRFWGVWRRDMLPVAYEHTQITLPDFYGLRRVLRRYAKLRLRNTRQHRRVSCFMSHETTRRLLEYYGYYRS